MSTTQLKAIETIYVVGRNDQGPVRICSAANVARLKSLGSGKPNALKILYESDVCSPDFVAAIVELRLCDFSGKPNSKYFDVAAIEVYKLINSLAQKFCEGESPSQL